MPAAKLQQFSPMNISRQCQLFVFAILIGLAAVLLPYVASAHVMPLHVLPIHFAGN